MSSAKKSAFRLHPMAEQSLVVVGERIGVQLDPISCWRWLSLWAGAASPSAESDGRGTRPARWPRRLSSQFHRRIYADRRREQVPGRHPVRLFRAGFFRQSVPSHVVPGGDGTDLSFVRGGMRPVPLPSQTGGRLSFLDRRHRVLSLGLFLSHSQPVAGNRSARLGAGPPHLPLHDAAPFMGGLRGDFVSNLPPP